MAARDKAIHLAEAKQSAGAAGAQIVAEPGRKLLSGEFTTFLNAATDRGSPEAKEVYELAGEEFLKVISKTYADEITPDDLTK